MTNAIKREVINFGLSTIRNLVSILWFAIWYRVFSTQEVRDDVDSIVFTAKLTLSEASPPANKQGPLCPVGTKPFEHNSLQF